MCCVCVLSSLSLWTSSLLDVPAGVTQEEGHTEFLIHLLSAVRASMFLARRIQPFLSLVDCEVGICVLTIESFSTRWAFLGQSKAGVFGELELWAVLPFCTLVCPNLLILSELVIFRNLLPGTAYGSFVCLFLYLILD